MTNPWLDPNVALAQRALVDEQMAQWTAGTARHQHFDAIRDAVRETECAGSVLEIGCGVGHTREILDRSGIRYRSFTGNDISETALALAKERYPESKWIRSTEGEIGPFVVFGDPSTVRPVQFDTVIDGSCVLHVEDWRGHLRALCAASRRWVILHRVPHANGAVTHGTKTSGYGHEFPSWCFDLDDITQKMAAHDFVAVENRTADGNSVTMTFARPRHWATYCDKNYLGRLKALHVSMVRHCGPFVLHVLAWDDEVHEWAAKTPGVRSQLVGEWLNKHTEFQRDNLPGPRRTMVEHYWTCGPQWISDVMGATGAPVTYVDADIMFHSSPEPVFAEIGSARAAVFPHGFAPSSAGLPGPTRETHEVFGKYNVGLVHFADRTVVDAWSEDCRAWCYDRVEAMEAEAGAVPQGNRRLRYGDQKFLDAWTEDTYSNVSRFCGAHVVKHPGAELGPWAVHTRALDVRNGVIYFGNRPLVAYHYSGLKELPDGHTCATRPEYRLTTRQESILYSPYYDALREAGK